MTNEPGVKQRADRRGLRSLNGKFYHTKQERNAADRAFNKALKDLPGDLAKEREAAATLKRENAQPFDFTYNQDPKEDPAAATIVMPCYHCTNCHISVDHGTPVCPGCGGRLNWEGL